MGKKRILIVDDDDLVLLTHQFNLSAIGYDVDTAESGEKAIEILDKGFSYDLVITDLRMYGESGVDVFNKVIEINVNIPVLVISGISKDSSLFKEAIELKPCGHMIKPFSEEAFLEKVLICLERGS